MGWAWETATPRERADFVRQHIPLRGTKGRQLTREELRSLFRLTDDGLERIAAGDDWRQEYERAAPSHGREG